MSAPEETRRIPPWLIVGAKVGASMMAVVFGLVTVLHITATGRYGTFGEPLTKRPLLDDEVFRFSALGAFVAVSIPVFVFWTRRHRLLAAAAGAIASLIVAFLARDIAHG